MTPDNSYKQEIITSPIVLLHGWGMNKNIWQPFVESLPEHVQTRIQLLDLPGFGHNEFMPNNYDLASLSAWLNEQITEPSAVLGWSLGGLVAQQFALDNPNKTTKLGLIATTPKFMAEQEWHGIDVTVLDMFAEQLSIDHQQTIERFLAIQAMGARTAKQDIKRIRDLVLSAPVPNIVALRQGLELLKEVDLRPSFDSYSLPVSAIFGRLDSLVPHKAVKLMQELSTNIDVTVLPKASHAPFISHLDEFNQWFESFIN